MIVQASRAGWIAPHLGPQNIGMIQTTIQASPGKTVVLGGLTTEKSPRQSQQAEIVVILTPRVIWNQREADQIK
jgi:type II secretory pathway component GspD/PulD (secretin)